MAYDPCQLVSLEEGVNCIEQLGGVGTTCYFFNKADLKAEPTMDETDPNYIADAGLTFNTGKGLYKLPLVADKSKYDFASIANNKGFKQSGSLITDQSGTKLAQLLRALNNNHVGVLIDDGSGEYIVMYNHNRRSTFNISGTTGDTAESDSNTTIAIETVSVWSEVRYKGALVMAGASPA